MPATEPSSDRADKPVEIAIVGGGPAALVTGLLLHRLGRQVQLLTGPEGAPGAAPQGRDLAILLPASALETLGFLGLGPALAAAGQPIESAALAWEGPQRPHAGDHGLQIEEPKLRAVLLQAVRAAGLTPDTRRVAALEPGQDATVVRLERGPALSVPLVLCAVAALLPEQARARALPHPDRLALTQLPHSDLAAFPHRHHWLATTPGWWAWALRRGAHLQLSWFGDEESTPALHPDLGTPPAAGLSWSRPVQLHSTVPPAQLPARLWPLGRAAYALSPLSSLGTAHALSSARLTAAAANTVFQARRAPAELAIWLLERMQVDAGRAHALTQLGCEGPAEQHRTAFWRRRADTTPLYAALPRDVAAAVTRAVELQRLHRAGSLFEARFALTAWQEEPTLCLMGPMLRQRPGWRAPGGLAIGGPQLAQLGPVARWFEQPRSLEEVLALATRGQPESTHARWQQQLTRDLSHLYEVGLLTRV